MGSRENKEKKYRKKIIQFFKENDSDLPKTQNIKDFSRGVGQKVFITSHKKNKYVFKFLLENKNSLHNINWIMERCLKLNLETPKIIYSNKDYLVESFMKGSVLSKIKLKPSQYKKIYFEIGNFLKKLHSIKSIGYTKNNKKINKNSKISLSIEIEKEFKENFKFLMNSGLVKKELGTKIKEYYDKNKSFLKKDKLVLSHDDLNENHVYVFNGNFSGIIDFDDGGFKHPEKEFRHFYFKLKNNYKFQSLMNGYGREINLKKIEFFIFLDCLWRIPCYYREKRYKSFKENKDYLFKIIKK